jgi:hypothetical protein
VVWNRGLTAEPRTLRAVDTTALTVTFTVALANPHGIGAAVMVNDKSLTADAAAGAVSLALNDRLGLEIGDVLRIGPAANEEYATIAALTGGQNAPPDAGSIVLTSPLALRHVVGEPIARQRLGPPAVVRQPASLVLAATAGDLALCERELSSMPAV